MAKDYTALRQALLDRVPQLTDRWTDRNPSDIGMVLLELFCGVGDMLAYYLDAQTAEAFLPTAKQRQNVIALCALIGYRLHRVVSATTTLRFTLESRLSEALVIPSGTRCHAKTDQGTVPFETMEDAILAQGELRIDIPAWQGERQTQTATATGQAWQTLRLRSTTIAEHSLQVTIQDQPWTVVTHFQESLPDSRHVVADTDAMDVTTLTFGDGTMAAIPEADQPITITWLDSQGAAGNLGPHRITTIDSTLRHHDQPVALMVTNPVAATGGAPRETIAHAKQRAPASLRSGWKAVTLQDYLTLALAFPGVAKVTVLDTTTCAAMRVYTVHLVMAPEGGGMPSPALKAALLAYLEQRKVITVALQLFDPVYQAIPIAATLYYWSDQDEATIRHRVESVLADQFAFARVQFGDTVHTSDLIAALDGVAGISHVQLHQPTHDVTCHAGELPTLGTLDLTYRQVAP